MWNALTGLFYVDSIFSSSSIVNNAGGACWRSHIRSHKHKTFRPFVVSCRLKRRVNWKGQSCKQVMVRGWNIGIYSVWLVITYWKSCLCYVGSLFRWAADSPYCFRMLSHCCSSTTISSESKGCTEARMIFASHLTTISGLGSVFIRHLREFLPAYIWVYGQD